MKQVVLLLTLFVCAVALAEEAKTETKPILKLEEGSWVEWRITAPALKPLPAFYKRLKLPELPEEYKKSASNDEDLSVERKITALDIKEEPVTVHLRLYVKKVVEQKADLILRLSTGKHVMNMEQKDLDLHEIFDKMLANRVASTPSRELKTLHIANRRLRVKALIWKSGKDAGKLDFEKWESSELPFGPARLMVKSPDTTKNFDMISVGFGRGREPSFPLDFTPQPKAAKPKDTEKEKE